MKSMRSFPKNLISALAVAALGLVSVAFASASPSKPAQAQKVNHYIGAAKCKFCHSTPENGNQFDVWSKSKHALAFQSLASEAGKKLAAEKGISDPQKDEKCAKCHVTGFGLPDEQFKKGVDRSGVQCEACHGPGEAHMSARMAAAQADEKADPKVRKVLPEGEILLNANPKFCQGCHNAQSPSFKAFCFHERLEKIAHYDPRGTRKPSAPLSACPCESDCECKKGPCKDLPKK